MREQIERCCRYTASSEAESVRSVLMDLGKAGLELKALANKACDSVSDHVLQAVQPSLEPLSSTSFVLDDAQYLVLEVRIRAFLTPYDR